MNRVERYLGRILAQYIGLVLVVLLSLFAFFEFLNQLGKMQAGYDLWQVLRYSVYKLPVYGYELFPLAVLIGTLMGLGTLANQSELVVLRVTGWSLTRLFWAVLKTVFLLWALAFAIGEGLAPKAEVAAEKTRLEALNQNVTLGQRRDMWVREQNRILHIGQALSHQVFLDVSVYRVADGRLQAWVKADRAQYQQGQWQLIAPKVHQITFEAAPGLSSLFERMAAKTDAAPPGSMAFEPAWLQYQQTQPETAPLALGLAPDFLERMSVKTRHMSVFDLSAYIDFLRANDLQAREFALAYWRKWALPGVLIGMLLLAFPLVMGAQRQVSRGQRVFIGVVIGLSFHLINQVFGNVSVVYQWPAWLGAWMPSLLLILVGLGALRRLR